MEIRTKRLPGKRTSALMRECTVRPLSRSPQMPTVRPERRPFSSEMVKRSVSVWVGCRWPPSPALTTGTSEKSEAASAAPSWGWRMTMAST